jgi:hypothetical protein
MGEEARGHKIAAVRSGVEEKATEEDEENGVNPTLGHPIYRGVH